MWKLKFVGKKPLLKNPVLIEGLPGIGNVGKITADFLIDEIKAKKIAEFQGEGLPHSAFINEENLIELPSIELFYKRNKNGKDVLIVAGDAQPVDDKSCYAFCEQVLNLAEEYKCSEIITLGGIALKQEPQNPQVYCTGNDKQKINSYVKNTSLRNDLYGIIGPIIGVSGVLPGLAKRRKIPAISLLAETYNHPLYIGIKGAKEILRIIKQKLKVNLNVETLDKEIGEIEEALNEKAKEIKEKQQKEFKATYIG
ncbi:hypothetical protein DRJ22_02750 [Candidatus Woesearchaeota archaeon]|nr:MAG: hypothetical protein B6U93_01565 [Candidatus Woesearchaeota archaeon ex4484_78]RLE46118.1 MAG: hypothetical protein DRJ22_02750 [Candidatus Woesearchaeota archaeon]